MTIAEAKEQQRMEMQRVIGLIKDIIEVPGEQTGYVTSGSKLEGILKRILKYERFSRNLFDNIPE